MTARPTPPPLSEGVTPRPVLVVVPSPLTAFAREIGRIAAEMAGEANDQAAGIVTLAKRRPR